MEPSKPDSANPDFEFSENLTLSPTKEVKFDSPKDQRSTPGLEPDNFDPRTYVRRKSSYMETMVEGDQIHIGIDVGGT
jgi:hypothetical protein